MPRYKPTWGEKEVSAYTPVPVPRNANGIILQVDMSAYEPGVYRFAGSFLFAVLIGRIMHNHHVDIGKIPDVETAPAGGSAFGDHNPIKGDAFDPARPDGGTSSNPGNVATTGRPTGSRLLVISGNEHAYLRCVCAHDGPNASGVGSVYASGNLNWNKVAELPGV